MSVCLSQNVHTEAYRVENGGLAQMVERALSKHEVPPGSMPGSSTLIFLFLVMNVCWFQSTDLRELIVLKPGISSGPAELLWNWGGWLVTQSGGAENTFSQ